MFPRLMKDTTFPVLGIAAGVVALFLFGILYGNTGHPAALVAGCGGGLLLLAVSALAARGADTRAGTTDGTPKE